jgi:MYXO-CTERM domain-containing protein
VGFVWISGGAVDTVDVAVVGIVDSVGGGECTGALIAPDLVLTAQHCVATVMNIGPCTQGSFGPPRAATNFYVTTRPAFTATPSDYHRAAAIVLPPGTGFCGRDIALLRLANRAITGEATSIDPRIDIPVAALETYAAVGYGATDDSGTGSGMRRRRDGLAASCVGAGCASTYINGAEWRGQAGVCIGDSGGPALDALGRVIGVASRGSAGCIDPVYESVAAHRDWLVAAAVEAATAGGYAPPAWTGVAPTIDAGVDAPGVAPDAANAPDAGNGADDGAGGCGCRTPSGAADGSFAWLLAGGVAALIGRIRRSGTRSGTRRS